MPTSPILAVPTPVAASPVNIPADTLAMATALDTKGVPRFANTGLRDAAMTALGGAIAGMVAYTGSSLSLCTLGGGTGTWLVIAPQLRVGGTWRRAAGQNVPNNTLTVISWDTEVADSSTFLTPPSTTVTIPAGADGMYGVSVHLYTGHESGEALLTITGVAEALSGRANARSGVASVSTFVPLAAGNTITASAWQTSGGAINAGGRLNVYRVGP